MISALRNHYFIFTVIFVWVLMATGKCVHLDNRVKRVCMASCFTACNHSEMDCYRCCVRSGIIGKRKSLLPHRSSKGQHKNNSHLR